MTKVIGTSISIGTTKVRDSSLELFRIVLMLMIIAHHYVVNSGLCERIFQDGAGMVSWKGLSFLMFGAWGEIGINCFILITGYFMCTGRASVQKFLKLYFQIVFYKVVVGFAFVFSGYEVFKITNVLKWLWPIQNLTSGFTSAFMAFFLLVPFLNVLLNELDRKKSLQLILTLLFIFSFLPTLPSFIIPSISNNYVSWFCIVYIVGAFIRKYPLEIFDNRICMAFAAGIVFIVGNVSVVIMTKLFEGPWSYWVSDSYKLTALVASVAFFLFFKSLRLPYIKLVNVVASTTFGVLLIHANSDVMRKWLWRDICQNVDKFHEGVMRAAVVVFCVYAVCVSLDLCRQFLFARLNELLSVRRA